MKCPACAAETSDAAPECAACGVIIAKALEKKEREKKLAAEFLAAAEAPREKPIDPWVGRGIAIAVVCLWFGALFFYYVKVMNEAEARAERQRLAAPPPFAAPAAAPPPRGTF